MINEYDINDMIDQIWRELPPQACELNIKDNEEGGADIDMKPFVKAYTEELCKLLASHMDKAWYFDAANTIRKLAGIPISIVAPCSAHAREEE